MELSAHIDWISATLRGVTFSGAGIEALLRMTSYGLHPEFKGMSWRQVKARNGYTVALKSETGILVMSHPDRPDMGTHVVMSGGTLARTAEHGIKPDSIIDWLSENGHSITRTDYAIDAKNSGLSIANLARQIENKEHKTRARSAPYVDDKIRGGKTQYIGSMKNRTKLVRIYDKAVELKDMVSDHIRIEMELHGMHANSSAIMAQNSDNLAKTIQSLIKAYVDFPKDEIWQAIIGSDEIWLAVPEKVQGNTEAWLLNQCAPALARLLDEDESFMYRFMEKVRENRQ